ncbi:(heptosyl)LPS beta-1,4-glucosyltransferase [Desulfarculales bacterium]
MPTLSVALICRDEEANLPAWLTAASAVADQIVAVDSGSSDATLEMLRRAGATVLARAWSGYSDQRNAAAELCIGDWILFLDADERPDARLTQALMELKQGPEPGEQGFKLGFKVFFFSRHLAHGGYGSERHLRLYRRGRGRWEDREVHERLAVMGPVGTLPGQVAHHSYQSVRQYLSRLERYSAEAARQMRAAGRRASGPTAWGHATWAFINRYLLRLGFLDGFEGYLAARLEALYTLIKYARLRELERGIEDRP